MSSHFSPIPVGLDPANDGLRDDIDLVSMKINGVVYGIPRGVIVKNHACHGKCGYITHYGQPIEHKIIENVINNAGNNNERLNVTEDNIIKYLIIAKFFEMATLQYSLIWHIVKFASMYPPQFIKLRDGSSVHQKVLEFGKYSCVRCGKDDLSSACCTFDSPVKSIRVDESKFMDINRFSAKQLFTSEEYLLIHNVVYSMGFAQHDTELLTWLFVLYSSITDRDIAELGSFHNSNLWQNTLTLIRKNV